MASSAPTTTASSNTLSAFMKSEYPLPLPSLCLHDYSTNPWLKKRLLLSPSIINSHWQLRHVLTAIGSVAAGKIDFSAPDRQTAPSPANRFLTSRISRGGSRCQLG